MKRKSSFHMRAYVSTYLGFSGLGMGKLCLSGYSEKVGIPLKRLINRFALNGYKAVETETINEIAAKLNTSSAALIELFSRPPQADWKLKE